MREDSPHSPNFFPVPHLKGLLLTGLSLERTKTCFDMPFFLFALAFRKPVVFSQEGLWKIKVHGFVDCGPRI